MSNGSSFKLLLTKDLSAKLISCPFFWRLGGSTPGSAWAMGVVTRVPDAAQRGSVSAICAFDAGGNLLPGFPVKGAEIPPGYQVSTADLNGDRKDELIAVDVEGRVSALAISGNPLPGFPSQPSRAIRLKCEPVVRDINADGRPELVLLSDRDDRRGSESALSVLDPSGRMLPGFPVPLKPPPATRILLADLAGSGACRVVFCREDGSIHAFDLSGAAPARIGIVPAETAANAVLAAVDLDGNRADEVVFATGSEEIQWARLGGGPAPAGWPFKLRNASFVGLAAARLRDGTSVLAAYDQARRRVAIFKRGAESPGVSLLPGGREKRFMSLSAAERPGPAGPCFIALFYDPGGGTDVDTAFETHATPEMKARSERRRSAEKARFDEPLTEEESQKVENKVREYKRFLLTDHLGQEKTDEVVLGTEATEAWVLDASGKPLYGQPIRAPGCHPFVDSRGNVPAAPALLYDESARRALLLLGLNGKELAPGRLCLYALP